MLATFEQKISAVKLDPKLGFTGPGTCSTVLLVDVGTTGDALCTALGRCFFFMFHLHHQYDPIRSHTCVSMFIRNVAVVVVE